jgi:hypothetical protein
VMLYIYISVNPNTNDYKGVHNKISHYDLPICSNSSIQGSHSQSIRSAAILVISVIIYTPSSKMVHEDCFDEYIWFEHTCGN